MSDGIRHAPDDCLFAVYGRVVFGMQAVERSLKVALVESIVELDRLTPETKRALETITLGSMIDKLDGLVRPRFHDEFEDLRNYVKNRNYVVHQFFVDFVDAVGDEARNAKAEAFLGICQCEAVLATNRIETITRALRLPRHVAHTERRDLELLEKLKIEPSRRIVIRRLRDA